jgi:hypothetical protein
MTSSQRSKLSLGCRGSKKDKRQKTLDTFLVKSEDATSRTVKSSNVETVDLSSDDEEESSFMAGCKPITSKRTSPLNR